MSLGEHSKWTRRSFVGGGGAAAVALAGGEVYRRYERFQTAEVFIGKAESYRSDLRDVIGRGLSELRWSRLEVRGKRVMLKPNLVEPDLDAPHINTHPEFIRATADVFMSLGAREVFIGEGPGHCRDTLLVLEESGVMEYLRDTHSEFVDLNLDDVDATPNAGRCTKLKQMFLPRSLKRADLIVSLPKLKTHHWAGATLSMKNFFGVMPGICYGWPKNVLHREGIHESIVDIVSTVRPHLAIVDGIVGMEGDGPIMGTPKPMGCVIMGRNLPAVDATCCRLMRINPGKIDYLARVSGKLGPIREGGIRQRGESIASVTREFDLSGEGSVRQYRL